MYLLVSPDDISPVRGLANIVFTLPHPLIYFFLNKVQFAYAFLMNFKVLIYRKFGFKYL